ncbi:MAG: acyl-CoA dehydrogenase family protein [Actinomycetota bacterium]|nr:acyl-CoA dehydrogenase family protein [Actinomycetota bacterium]
MPDIAAQVNAWVDDNWDTSLTLREWWKRLAAAGYSQPTWPQGQGGCSASGATARIISETLGARGVIAAPTGMGPHMAAPMIMKHGTDAQKAEIIKIATGEQHWCQLFSEPEAGSDLASVRCKAVRDGEEYIVNGQKVWNSGADAADRGMLLARTDFEAQKHAGVSFILIDMLQPGIEVRPLVTMNGSAHFCEVFLTDARAAAHELVGTEGGGWAVATTVLGLERKMAASGSARGALTVVGGSKSGNLDRTCAELFEIAAEKAKEKPQAMISSSRVLIKQAQKAGVNTDPVLRDDLARYHIRSEVYRLTNLRARQTGGSGPEASIAKIALSGMARHSRDLGLRILGAGGMLIGNDSASGGALQYAALSTGGVSIGGGTDEIQHNVIGERALGLPKEPA